MKRPDLLTWSQAHSCCDTSTSQCALKSYCQVYMPCQEEEYHECSCSTHDQSPREVVILFLRKELSQHCDTSADRTAFPA